MIGPKARSPGACGHPDCGRIARTSSSKCTNLTRRGPGMPANAARPDRELPEIRPRPSFSAAMLSHHLKRGRLGMTISELPQRWQNSPARYAAVFSIVAAILLCDVITRLLHAESIGLSMLCAVIFTAWAAGFGPALLAIALALLSFHY